MIFKGLRLNGLSIQDYVPLNLTQIELAYSVKQHKYGFDATWSHSTDLYYPTVLKRGFDAEINALKHNLQMTVFASSKFTNGVVNDLKGFYDSGKVGIGSYEYTAKDYADGILNDETYMANIQAQYDWVKNNFGYYPSVGSYGYGLLTFQNQLKDFYLGVRNSGADVADFDYNLTDPSSFRATTRQADMVGDRPTVLAQCAAVLSDAIANNGWYRDFTHWHNCTGTMIGDYFASQRAAIGANRVITLDMGTAMEYMRFRQNLNGVAFYTDGTSIFVSADVATTGLVAQDINTTISIAVDLTGTVLSGMEIMTSHGAQKVATNNFIVEVPIGGYAILSQNTIGQYLDFELPTVTNLTTTNVTTDKPCRISIFKVPMNDDINNALLVSRDNVLSTTHTLDLSSVDLLSYDVYVGCTTKDKQSILSKI